MSTEVSRRDDFGEKAYFKKIIRKKELEGLFLFVTSKCNSKCRTCFYADDLNQQNDLTFEQIMRISETAPRFDKLWISGGEPFLRERFTEIIESFYRNNGITTVNLPTNGLLPERIEKGIGEIREKCPELTLHLNFSLDGFPRTNEIIRGVPGGFEKTMESMERVSEAFGGDGFVHVNAATVLTPENFDELIDLSRYLFKRLPRLGFHLSEPARGISPDPAVQNLTRGDVERMHEDFRPVLDTICERMFGHLKGPKRYLANLGFAGLISFMFQLTEECYEGPNPWGMSCPAGVTTIVIDADGSFRSCEIRDRIGHLRDYDYNLTDAFRSEAMRREVEAIGGGYRADCWCTHGCWISSALKFAPGVLLAKVPKAYRRHRKNSPGPLDLDAVDLHALEEKYGIRR
jgi:MoaA/NifB/PqqE/SkfB family radical SAM enzyme